MTSGDELKRLNGPAAFARNLRDITRRYRAMLSKLVLPRWPDKALRITFGAHIN